MGASRRSVAAWIPGPIGAAAAGIAAVAYAASGNTRQALIMGATAAAQMVGAGVAVRAAARIASTATKAGTRASRAAPKVQRAASVARRCNSFVPGTLVRLADGTAIPIETLQPGDLVLAADPATGEVSAQPVITPITGTGEKHLVRVELADGTAWTATANHQVWVEGSGWTDTADLTDGDRLRGSSGASVLIAATHDLGWIPRQTVHNVHIAGPHTYYITSAENKGADSLVHNANCGANPSAKEVARAAMRHGDKGTFPNRTQSIRYHYGKHALPGQSLSSYITQGATLSKKVGETGKKVYVRGRGGGIVSPRGKTYTTW